MCVGCQVAGVDTSVPPLLGSQECWLFSTAGPGTGDSHLGEKKGLMRRPYLGKTMGASPDQSEMGYYLMLCLSIYLTRIVGGDVGDSS